MMNADASPADGTVAVILTWFFVVAESSTSEASVAPTTPDPALSQDVAG